jgi:hypothetical protein
MADYGIKISKAGTDVKDVPTTTTKKNFVVLSTDSVHKVSAQAVVSSDTNIEHGLGFTPMFDAYTLNDSLTAAKLNKYDDFYEYYYVSSDSTYLYINEIWGSNSLFYIIYLDSP